MHLTSSTSSTCSFLPLARGALEPKHQADGVRECQLKKCRLIILDSLSARLQLLPRRPSRCELGTSGFISPLHDRAGAGAERADSPHPQEKNGVEGTRQFALELGEEKQTAACLEARHSVASASLQDSSCTSSKHTINKLSAEAYKERTQVGDYRSLVFYAIRPAIQVTLTGLLTGLSIGVFAVV